MWRISAGRRWSRLGGVVVGVREAKDIVARAMSREGQASRGG
jgi:hypothetical protein